MTAMTEDELLALLTMGLRAAGVHPRIKAEAVLTQIRHDHGERIAQDLISAPVPNLPGHPRYLDGYIQGRHDSARRARDLSPAPEAKP